MITGAAAEALNHIGIVYRSIGQYDEALKNLHEAEEIYKRLNDLKGLGKCTNSLGTAYWWSKDYPNAIGCYAEANRLNDKMNQPYILGLTATNLGYICLEKGDYAKALDAFSRGRLIRQSPSTEPYELTDVSGMAARACISERSTGRKSFPVARWKD